MSGSWRLSKVDLYLWIHIYTQQINERRMATLSTTVLSKLTGTQSILRQTMLAYLRLTSTREATYVKMYKFPRHNRRL